MVKAKKLDEVVEKYKHLFDNKEKAITYLAGFQELEEAGVDDAGLKRYVELCSSVEPESGGGSFCYGVRFNVSKETAALQVSCGVIYDEDDGSQKERIIAINRHRNCVRALPEVIAYAHNHPESSAVVGDFFEALSELTGYGSTTIYPHSEFGEDFDASGCWDIYYMIYPKDYIKGWEKIGKKVNRALNILDSLGQEDMNGYINQDWPDDADLYTDDKDRFIAFFTSLPEQEAELALGIAERLRHESNGKGVFYIPKLLEGIKQELETRYGDKKNKTNGGNENGN
jgi:hypothetical protein